MRNLAGMLLKEKASPSSSSSSLVLSNNPGSPSAHQIGQSSPQQHPNANSSLSLKTGVNNNNVSDTASFRSAVASPRGTEVEGMGLLSSPDESGGVGDGVGRMRGTNEGDDEDSDWDDDDLDDGGFDPNADLGNNNNSINTPNINNASNAALDHHHYHDVTSPSANTTTSQSSGIGLAGFGASLGLLGVNTSSANMSDSLQSSASPSLLSPPNTAGNDDVSMDDKSSASASGPTLKGSSFKAFSIWGKRKFGTSGGSRKTTVRVQTRKKEIVELNHLGCVQVLAGAHVGPIWVCEFSVDGLFLASAGKDKKICVWEVLKHPSSSSPVHRTTSTSTSLDPNNAESFSGVLVNGPPVFAPSPKSILVGHASDVTSLAWNASNFIVSGRCIFFLLL